jgi:hypothetical protein
VGEGEVEQEVGVVEVEEVGAEVVVVEGGEEEEEEEEEELVVLLVVEEKQEEQEEVAGGVVEQPVARRAPRWGQDSSACSCLLMTTSTRGDLTTSTRGGLTTSIRVGSGRRRASQLAAVRRSATASTVRTLRHPAVQ